MNYFGVSGCYVIVGKSYTLSEIFSCIALEWNWTRDVSSISRGMEGDYQSSGATIALRDPSIQIQINLKMIMIDT